MTIANILNVFVNMSKNRTKFLYYVYHWYHGYVEFTLTELKLSIKSFTY